MNTHLKELMGVVEFPLKELIGDSNQRVLKRFRSVGEEVRVSVHVHARKRA